MRIFAIGSLFLCFTLPAMAGEWYEDYEAGKRNCDAGNYGICIAKMNAATSKKPKSEKQARTYGINFIDYTPYYYLGLSYMQQGNVENADKFFQTEADFGVIYKTGNNGSFSLMSKQAAQALQTATKQTGGDAIQNRNAAAERARQESETASRKVQAGNASQTSETGFEFRNHEDLADLRGEISVLRHRVEELETGARPSDSNACKQRRHIGLLLLLIAALQAAGLIVMLRRK